MEHVSRDYMRANVERDPRQFASFFVKPDLKATALAEGRPVHADKVYFRLERAGERDVHMAEATEQHKREHPKAWEDFVARRKPRPEGVPLSILWPNFPERVATMEFHHVYTVEQLAALQDGVLHNIGIGGMQWRTEAQKYLDHANSSAGFSKLSAELAAAQATIEKQEGLIRELESKVHHAISRVNAVLPTARGDVVIMNPDDRSQYGTGPLISPEPMGVPEPRMDHRGHVQNVSEDLQHGVPASAAPAHVQQPAIPQELLNFLQTMQSQINAQGAHLAKLMDAKVEAAPEAEKPKQKRGRRPKVVEAELGDGD